ncbi:MAG: hemolysin family protein [Nanobdellota archaeon]
MIEFLLMLIVLLVLSGVFSGLETAFLTLSHVKARSLYNQKQKNSEFLLKLKNNQRRLIITILIGNNLVNVASSSIATVVFTEAFGSAGIGVATGIMTLLILTFGEILPKTSFAKHSTKISLIASKYILFLEYLLLPVIFLFELLSNFLKMDNKNPDIVTESEIETMIEMGAEKEVLHKKQKQMMKSVFQFDDIKVKEIMTPRTDVFSIQEDEIVKDIRKKLSNTCYSRVPVYSKDIDNIIGYLHIRDLIPSGNSSKKKAKDIYKKIIFVSGEKIIQELFSEFQKYRMQMAVVLDEFGGTAGIVTMEDILEEIVGEITDESDNEEYFFKRISKDSYLFDGDVNINDLNEALRIKIPENGHYSTLGGYIQYKLNDFPEIGQEIKDKKNRLAMSVQKIRHHKIDKVKIKKI